MRYKRDLRPYFKRRLIMQEFFVYLNNIIPDIGIKNIIEIIIMSIIIYKITISVKNIKAWIFLKGIIIVIGFYIISDILELYAIKMIFTTFAS